jgi:carboxylesterase type B
MVLISISMTTAVDVFVNTTRGLVQGWNVDSGMNQSNIYYGSADVFLGIPYVQAPIGQLRFKVNIH